MKARYADDAFSGEASRRRGGRWNPPGIAVVYTSSTIALAALETLVHIESEVIVDFVSAACSFHEALVEKVDRARLPEGWRSPSPPRILQDIGHEWGVSRSSAVLEVPSAVIDQEINYLLNPEHPDFASIDFSEPQPFTLDLRLLTCPSPPLPRRVC
ncbi:MAG TPA: RES domain-containing protein [Thermoanaerobaculia bacterium]